MRVSDCVACTTFPCRDVRTECYVVPEVKVRPAEVRVVLISEAAPPERFDWYYAEGAPLLAQTTVQAFRDAGVDVASIRDVLGLGVYLTTAAKCGKTGYGLAAADRAARRYSRTSCTCQGCRSSCRRRPRQSRRPVCGSSVALTRMAASLPSGAR